MNSGDVFYSFAGIFCFGVLFGVIISSILLALFLPNKFKNPDNDTKIIENNKEREYNIEKLEELKKKIVIDVIKAINEEIENGIKDI